MLCSGPRIQPKLLLALSLLSSGAAALLYLCLDSLGRLADAAQPSSAGPLRALCFLGAVVVLLCCGLLLHLRCFLRERRDVMSQLRSRHDFLTLLQAHSPDDILVVDAAGMVVSHNRRYRDLWEEPAPPFRPLPFLRVMAPLLAKVRDPDACLANTRDPGSNGKAEVRDQLVLVDGRIFGRYCAPLHGRDGTLRGRIWRLRDSTASFGTLAAIRESEQTYRGVVESSADAMVVVDEAHLIVLVNEQFELMFGYPRSEVLGKDVEILVPRRFTSHTRYVTEFFQSPRKRMMGIGLKLVAQRRDGSEFPVEIGLSPLRTSQGLVVSAAIRDVTQREVAEKKVAAAAAYARTLFEASPDPLLTIDKEGEIRDVNEAMIALTEKAREELIGSRLADHCTDAERAQEVRHQVFDAGSVRDYPLTVRSRGGHLTDVLYNAVVYRDERGEVAGAFVSARDVTRLQAAEAELRDLNRVLEDRVHQRSESLLSQAMEVVEGATTVAAASRSIRELTTAAVRSAIDTSAALSHTTAAIEQVKQTAIDSSNKARHVSLTAQRSAEVAQGGRVAVQGAVAGMARIQVQVASSAESIVRLSQQSRTIGDIIATVNDLAEQSNLLAVNAAIEASKAGEQGKGFAVVAREVKNLSEQSKAATAQVRSILDDIRRATDGAVLASEQGRGSAAQGVEQARKVGEAIAEMEQSVELSAQAALQIVASCQQQLIGLEQVARAMESINEASGQNVAGMKRLEATLKRLEELGSKLDLLSAALRW